MKTIGILGGLGPESTSAYYDYITRKYHELYGDFAYPEILIHSLTFEPFIKAKYRCPNEIAAVIEGLAGAGADFVVAACNSIHIDYDEVCEKISIPWVSIMDAVAEQVQQKGLATVGLLGTVFTMGSNFYQNTFERYGINVVVPGDDAQAIVNKIIYEELVIGDVREDSRATVLEIMDDLRNVRFSRHLCSPFCAPNANIITGLVSGGQVS
jgi:aspartate racemase